ncbi:MAG TPA: OsmC family protein [Candidatus Eisenbacteria bacterium]|nr:OsmC family protein [Candidatus Eisenbacteria bacterium]
MKRHGSAVWTGSLKEGKGTVSTGSGTHQHVQYSFGTRFEEGTGTNPEELVAAAHAACFSMALSAQLTNAGTPPERINTTASLTFEKTEPGFTVTSIHLQTAAKVPGANAQSFEKAAQAAKTGCPISRLLNTEITLDAHLES